MWSLASSAYYVVWCPFEGSWEKNWPQRELHLTPRKRCSPQWWSWRDDYKDRTYIRNLIGCSFVLSVLTNFTFDVATSSCCQTCFTPYLPSFRRFVASNRAGRCAMYSCIMDFTYAIYGGLFFFLLTLLASATDCPWHIDFWRSEIVGIT